MSVSASGAFSYDPRGVAAFQNLAVGETAVDSFAYTMTDGHGATSSATVTVTVYPPTPRITSSSIVTGQVIAPGPLSVVIVFDRALNAAAIDASDTFLIGATTGVRAPSSVNYNAATLTLTLQYANVPEDAYTLELLSGNGHLEAVNGLDLDGEAAPGTTIPSGDGIPGGDFFVNFAVVRPTQHVAGTVDTASAPAGHSFSIEARYDTSDLDKSLSGLGLRMHYNSQLMTFGGLTNVLQTNLISQQTSVADVSDLDNDPSTDRYVLVAWADPISGNWPNAVLPTALYTATFTIREGATEGITSHIRFTASSTATTHQFVGDSIEVTVAPPYVDLDVDANGAVDALTDGVLILRYLFGFTGSALVTGAADPLGARTSPTEIVEFLSNGRTRMLDVDANGSADALSDGIVILRYLFGFTGQTLINERIDLEGDRTDPTEITAYLDSFNPSLPQGASLAALTAPPGLATATFASSAIAMGAPAPTISSAQPNVALLEGTNSQVVEPSTVSQVVQAGEIVSVDVRYTTSPLDTSLVGLGLRLHYDSSKLDFIDLSNVLGTQLVATSPPMDDSNDFDGDAATNKYILVAWSDPLGGNWPGENLPLSLFTANFVAAATFVTGSTWVNFTASSTSLGYTLTASSAEIKVAAAAQAADFNLSIVIARTPTDSSGQITGAATSASWLHEWQPYWAEVWVDTPFSNAVGIARAAVTLQYNTQYFTATLVEAGSAFSGGLTSTVNDALGRVHLDGNVTADNPVGKDGRVLLARIWMVPDIGAGVALNLAAAAPAAPASDNWLDWLADGSDVVKLSDNSTAAMGLVAAPDVDLWPVLYDLNDDGRISFGDLAIFAAAFLKPASQSPEGWKADFNADDSVDFGDFSLLAANFLKSIGTASSIILPENYPGGLAAANLVAPLPIKSTLVVEAAPLSVRTTDPSAPAATASAPVNVAESNLPVNLMTEAAANPVWFALPASLETTVSTVGAEVDSPDDSVAGRSEILAIASGNSGPASAPVAVGDESAWDDLVADASGNALLEWTALSDLAFAEAGTAEFDWLTDQRR